MNIEDLQTICATLPGTTEDIKWDNHLCFNVGEKMYLVTNPDAVPHSASFKAADENFEELCTRPGFKPAAYLARYKWVYVDDINRITKKEWQQLVHQSYNLVLAKLPARLRKEIAG